MKAGDVVIGFGGSDVTSASDLTALVRQQPAGKAIDIKVLRKGKELEFTVTLGDAATLK